MTVITDVITRTPFSFFSHSFLFQHFDRTSRVQTSFVEIVLSLGDAACITGSFRSLLFFSLFLYQNFPLHSFLVLFLPLSLFHSLPHSFFPHCFFLFCVPSGRHQSSVKWALRRIAMLYYAKVYTDA